MRYISTRGRAPALSFEEVTLAGLASDGGLYVPESWPQLSVETLRSLRTASYVEPAVAVMAPFVGDALSENEVRSRFSETYGRVDHACLTHPLPVYPRTWLLGLFP